MMMKQVKKFTQEGNVTYRATYLIDETGKIFHESVNDMPLGKKCTGVHGD